MQPDGLRHVETRATAADVRAELERILSSPEFVRRPQLQRFLNFVVEEELAGRGAQLKEYVLGVGVFGRPADFDPRLDSLVRVEARRLRATLEEYYSQRGRADPLRIELEKGSYEPVFQAGKMPRLEPDPPAEASIPVPVSTPGMRPGQYAGKIAIGAIVLAVAIGTVVFLHLRRIPHLTERDSIVLSDFVNSTGDPVFDETLKQGLRVALEQSPFLSILSDPQVGQLLRLMGQSSSTHINDALAREVCVRSGSKVMITGSISRESNRFVVGLTASNCANGDAIVHVRRDAPGKEKVLEALGTAAARMREKLGESMSSIQRFDVPLEEATTPSLEALQALGLGRRTAREKGSPADIPYYKLAIELDPNFAIAYAALGVSYVNLGQPSTGITYVRKAHELSERTSEHEKFRIASYYYHVVTGELDKSMATYELWKQSYPRDFAPYINLGLAFTWMGQYEKCAEETREALALDPDNVLSYSNLVASYIKLGRLQDAEQVLGKAAGRNLNSKFLRSNAYILAFARGDLTEMDRQLADARGKPGDEHPLLSLQSDTEAYYGRLKRARQFSQMAADSALRGHANEAAAGWLVNAGLREAEFGNPALARKDVADALGFSTGRDVLVLAGLALARAGDLEGAQRLARDLESGFSTNTIIQTYWLPVIRAAIELHRKNPQRAIELLQGASLFELGSPPPIGVATLYPVYLRAEAYLDMRQGDAAERELSKIISHPTLVLNFPLHALAYRQMGRARAMLHDPAGVRKAYEDCFHLWKDADPDNPVLRQAKAEYARLQ